MQGEGASQPRLLAWTATAALCLHVIAILSLHNMQVSGASKNGHQDMHGGVETEKSRVVERDRQLQQMFAAIDRAQRDVKPTAQQVTMDNMPAAINALPPQPKPCGDLQIADSDIVSPPRELLDTSSLIIDPAETCCEPLLHQPDTHQVSGKLLAATELVTRSSLEPRGSSNAVAGQKGGHLAKREDFLLDLTICSCQKGGYLFQIALIPRRDVDFLRIRQNIFFLIDRSHSIARARYEWTKNAVAQSLELLQEGDRFNILIFDKQVARFREEPVTWSLEILAEARRFLEDTPHGGVFASTDIYSSLDKIVPQEVSEHEVNTAILLSDGDTFLPKESQRAAIQRWSERNNGKVSLYSIASGTGNNLPLLDLLSVNNKGDLTFCPDHEGLPKVLKDLVSSLKNPIGKELSLSTVTTDLGSSITIFPSTRRQSNLYRDGPYLIYGHASEKADFFLFLQGRYYDRRFDIRQRITLADAKPAPRDKLERQVALHQAYDCYDRYLSDGDRKHLYRAKQILDPHKIAVAF